MICLSIMLNRVSARTQPCFTPLTMGKEPERSLFNLTWPRWSLCSWITMLRNFVEQQPRCSMIIHNPFLLTVSDALVRSTNTTYSPFFCSLHFSWTCLRMNTMLALLPLLAHNPHWVSGRWSSARVGINLFKSTRTRIFLQWRAE